MECHAVAGRRRDGDVEAHVGGGVGVALAETLGHVGDRGRHGREVVVRAAHGGERRGLALEHPAQICRGIVGHADLTLGDRVGAVLEAEIAAGGGRFNGIRYSGGWDDDPVIGNSHVASRGRACYRSAEFRAGLKRLFGLGLLFDAWIFHHQLAEVTELARAFPDGNIVLCHMGGVLGYGR